jgi:hypothetical protein
VPYNSSITFAVVLALLGPLTTTLYNLHTLYNSPDLNFPELSARFLQQNQCAQKITESNLTTFDATTNGTDVTEISPEELHEISTGEMEEKSTWTAIATSLIIATTIAAFCLALYEAYRRDPIVGKYVYDRKRLTQPNRTPPPLMLSRSLWTGTAKTNEKEASGWNVYGCCSWWKVRPALFELFFLTLDERYVRYSARADEARKERERSGYYTCCRAGCYHDNCCNKVKVRKLGIETEEEEFVDEDGYVYYPGFNHELGFRHVVS